MPGDPDPLTKRVGGHVTRLRERAKISQVALAKKAGVNASTINRLELGIAIPDVVRLDWIAVALGVSIAELFSDEDSDEQRRATRQVVRVLGRRTEEDVETVLKIVNLIFEIKQRGRRSRAK